MRRSISVVLAICTVLVGTPGHPPQLQGKNERIAAARERIEAEGKSWGRPQRLKVEDRDQIAALKAEGRSIGRSRWR